MRCKVKCIRRCLLLLLASLALAWWKGILTLYVDTSSDAFHLDSTCPACYGRGLCGEFYSGDLVLEGKDRFAVSQAVNAKNVYFGRLGNSTSVVVKALGHNHELRELDERICGLQPGRRRPAASSATP